MRPYGSLFMCKLLCYSVGEDILRQLLKLLCLNTFGESLKTKISASDKGRCCYCLTTEANSGIPMSYDHIQPRSKGGETTFDNISHEIRDVFFAEIERTPNRIEQFSPSIDL